MDDIRVAIRQIKIYAQGRSGGDLMTYDAIRMRIVEIGEAVKAIDPGLLRTEPGIPWPAIARMRDLLAHQYYDTDHSVVWSVVAEDLVPLAAAVDRLVEQVTG